MLTIHAEQTVCDDQLAHARWAATEQLLQVRHVIVPVDVQLALPSRANFLLIAAFGAVERPEQVTGETLSAKQRGVASPYSVLQGEPRQ